MERIGLGRSFILSRIQAQPSSKARMWQPQEQKKRPKIAVEAKAMAMKRKPAVTIPTSSVIRASLNSSGAMVRPESRQWRTWARTSTYTRRRVAARFLV